MKKKTKTIKAWIVIEYGQKQTREAILDGLIFCRGDLPKNFYWGYIKPCKITYEI